MQGAILIMTYLSSLIEADWHICVSKLTIIGSDNGLSPGRHQAIIWTNAGNSNRNQYIFIQENVFGKIVWKIAAILSLSQCVKINFVEFFLQDTPLLDRLNILHSFLGYLQSCCQWRWPYVFPLWFLVSNNTNKRLCLPRKIVPLFKQLYVLCLWKCMHIYFVSFVY